MKNKSSMFSNWSEVTGERNHIVFEHLNKSYGAYEIRTNYDRSLLKAFSAMGLFIIVSSVILLLIPSIPNPVKLIQESSNTKLTKPTEYKEELVEQKKDPMPPVKKTNSNAFYKPEVVDSVPNDSVPVLVLNNKPATGNSKDTTGTDTPETRVVDRGFELPLDTILDAPTDRPEFPGGDDGLFRFLRANTTIPPPIIEIGRVSEKVGVVFIVDREGFVTSATLLRGGCKYAELNNEALRVINKMPKWEPGKQNGKKVKVRLILPIRFEVK